MTQQESEEQPTGVSGGTAGPSGPGESTGEGGRGRGREGGRGRGREGGREGGRSGRRGRGHRHESHLDMPAFGPGFGPYGPFGPRGFGRGPRVKRGDVRAAALALLAEEPMHGYQVITEISERSDGVWRPSPGSVYPALNQLEDEGLVRAVVEPDNRRVFHLTDAGKAYVEAHPDEVDAPWDAVAGGLGATAFDMRNAMAGVGMALGQVIHTGSEAQIKRAFSVLDDAKRSLYRILAEDPAESGDGPGDGNSHT
jgi:DNA-binding PadR family transcriptional regulator